MKKLNWLGAYLLFFLSLPLLSYSQAVIHVTGTLESIERGDVFLLAVPSRDTLAKSKIEGYYFILESEREILASQVVPAMILCLQEDRQKSIAAPIALESSPLSVTIGKTGASGYSGSLFQIQFTDYMRSSAELGANLYDPETGMVIDSVQLILGERIESFYLQTRNTPYKSFTSLLINDFINRKFINPGDLKELVRICSESSSLDSFDQKVCNSMGLVEIQWEGLQAPNFNGLLLSEELFNLGDRVGKKVLVLDFWASWCGPCIKEMPELKEIHNEGKVEIIGISIDERKSDWERSLGKLNLPWTNIRDESKEIAKLYSVVAVPVKFVIDRNGVIVARNPEDLRKLINSLE